MEGRRRRAQRLTQDIQEQPVGEPELKETEPESSPEASFEPSEQTTQIPETTNSTIHRRRRAAVSSEQEVAQTHEPHAGPSKEERVIPRLPQIDERKPQVRIKTAQGRTAEEKKKKRLSVPKTLSGERVKRVASASAKAGMTVAKGLGGLTLLAMMFTAEGVRKLTAAAKRCYGFLKNAVKGKKEEASHTAQQAAQELELILPQDYHGRSQTHARATASGAKRHVQAKEGKEQLINRLISALLVCVALYSAWQIGAIVVRSVRTNRLNAELAAQRATIIEERNEAMEPESEAAQPMAVSEEATPAPQMEMAYVPESTPEPEAQILKATKAPDIVKSTIYRTVGGDALPEMEALYNKNRDLVAWIQIPDVLDLPVVYRDNSYYLTRDFNKQKNAAGTIFLDENHPFKEKTQNLLLHGHNMKDGTMFGRLAQYLYDDTYLRNHPFIYFDTLWRKEQYVIVAVLDVSLTPSDPRFFNYFTHDTFSSDAEFEMYIRQLQLRSRYAIPIDVQPSDALLTMSTCLDEDRLVIVTRRLRPNETRSELRELIRMTTKQ